MRRAALALLVVATAAPAGAAGGAAVAGRGLEPIVRILASERAQGRDNGTVESYEVQRAIIRRLRRIAKPLGHGRFGDAFRQQFTTGGEDGANVVGLIRGRELPDEYVVVGAHYDHLGTRSDVDGRCRSQGAPGGAVCNGATDDAAGVSVVLAIGRALARAPRPPRRSVVLALWDREEDGLLGSLEWVTHPLVPLAQTRAYVNFDIQGSNLLPSLARTSFAVGAETGGAPLQQVVADAIAREGLGTVPVSFIFGQLRSDYANFPPHGVATVFFSDSTNGCYHTVNDDVDRVDWAKLAAQSRIGYRVVSALAETSTPPILAAGGAVATYADAQSLADVFATAQGDLARFPPDDQQVLTGIRDAIRAIVDAGPAAFDEGDVLVLLDAALQGIAAIQRLGCPAP